MNNYVIDPQVFYWINTIDNFKEFCKTASALLFVGFVIALVAYFYNRYTVSLYTEDTNEYKSYKKAMDMATAICINCGVIVISLVFAWIFLPSKETSIQMLVAKTATFENFDWTAAQIKEMIDYIITAIKTI